jgi:hypothetical protein
MSVVGVTGSMWRLGREQEKYFFRFLAILSSCFGELLKIAGFRLKNATNEPSSNLNRTFAISERSTQPLVC